MPDPRPRPSNASYSGAQPARRAGAPALAPPRGRPARQRPTRPRSAPAPPPRSPGRTSSAWARARRPRRAAAGAARGPAAARATPGPPPARRLRRGAGQALCMGVGGTWQAGRGPRPGQSVHSHRSRSGWRAAALAVLVKGTHARLEHARAACLGWCAAGVREGGVRGRRAWRAKAQQHGGAGERAGRQQQAGRGEAAGHVGERADERRPRERPQAAHGLDQREACARCRQAP